MQDTLQDKSKDAQPQGDFIGICSLTPLGGLLKELT